MRSSFLLRAACVAALAQVVVTGRGAAAYSLEGCAWPDPAIAYADRSGAYAVSTERAVQDWNRAGTAIQLHADPAAAFVIQARNFGSTGYDGITELSCDGSGRFVRVTSSYNTYYTDAYGPQARESLIAHEIGHALGLAHSGSLPCPAPLMYGSSDRYARCGDVGPQPDDRAGLDAIARRAAPVR